jgi:hypothetical protein
LATVVHRRAYSMMAAHGDRLYSVESMAAIVFCRQARHSCTLPGTSRSTFLSSTFDIADDFIALLILVRIANCK